MNSGMMIRMNGNTWLSRIQPVAAAELGAEPGQGVGGRQRQTTVSSIVTVGDEQAVAPRPQVALLDRLVKLSK